MSTTAQHDELGQNGPAPDDGRACEEAGTGAHVAIQALAARGVTARTIVDADESWLIVGHDTATDAHALLHLYRGRRTAPTSTGCPTPTATTGTSRPSAPTASNWC